MYSSINERLELMEEVAQHKAASRQPVEDLERERVVIESSKAAAAQAGLDQESIEDFFVAQISVAKAIQYRYRADYLSRPPAGSPRDLQDEIRPLLLEIGGRILAQMDALLRERGSLEHVDAGRFNSAVTAGHVTDDDRRMLLAALRKVRWARD